MESINNISEKYIDKEILDSFSSMIFNALSSSETKDLNFVSTQNMSEGSGVITKFKVKSNFLKDKKLQTFLLEFYSTQEDISNEMKNAYEEISKSIKLTNDSSYVKFWTRITNDLAAITNFEINIKKSVFEIVYSLEKEVDIEFCKIKGIFESLLSVEDDVDKVDNRKESIEKLKNSIRTQGQDRGLDSEQINKNINEIMKIIEISNLSKNEKNSQLIFDNVAKANSEIRKGKYIDLWVKMEILKRYTSALNEIYSQLTVHPHENFWLNEVTNFNEYIKNFSKVRNFIMHPSTILIFSEKYSEYDEDLKNNFFKFVKEKNFIGIYHLSIKLISNEYNTNILEKLEFKQEIEKW